MSPHERAAMEAAIEAAQDSEVWSYESVWEAARAYVEPSSDVAVFGTKSGDIIVGPEPVPETLEQQNKALEAELRAGYGNIDHPLVKEMQNEPLPAEVVQELKDQTLEEAARAWATHPIDCSCKGRTFERDKYEGAIWGAQFQAAREDKLVEALRNLWQMVTFGNNNREQKIQHIKNATEILVTYRKESK